jgi:hypothetical protein
LRPAATVGLEDLPDSRDQETRHLTLEVAMSDLDDFLATTFARLVAALVRTRLADDHDAVLEAARARSSA